MGEGVHAATQGACGNPVGVAKLGVFVGTVGCASGVDVIGGENAATAGCTTGAAHAPPPAGGGAEERCFAGNALGTTSTRKGIVISCDSTKVLRNKGYRAPKRIAATTRGRVLPHLVSQPAALIGAVRKPALAGYEVRTILPVHGCDTSPQSPLGPRALDTLETVTGRLRFCRTLRRHVSPMRRSHGMVP